MELGKSRKTSHSSPASTPPTSSSTTKGVQKFYTKIRHKIEDLPPKITAKLHKNSSKQPSSGLTSSSPNGKFTPLTNNVQSKSKSVSKSSKFVTKSVQTSPIKENRKKDMVKSSPPKPSTAVKEDSIYEDIQVVSSNPNGSTSIVYVDSDEECRLSLNDSKISLEDEIFEELEKVAHDEAKLNAVLKNFDKILTDFTQTKQPKSMDYSKSTSLNQSLPAVSSSKTTPVSILPAPKKLQKSKTCSIIESRCILKKSISDPRDDLGKLAIGLGKPSNFNTTKSLWNLKDFEEFAKSGKKLEKIENCKLPVYTGLNKSVGSAIPPAKVTPTSASVGKITPGRSKSVWDMSGSTQSIAAGGRSKIPIMKSSSILSLSSRSNSFCDVNQQKSRSPPSVSKMVKSINDKSPIPSKMFNSATSSTPKISNLVKRRNLSSAVSTPHSLNRIGGGGSTTPKVSSASRSTIKPASSEVSLKKSITSSKISTAPLRKQQSSDVLLDKCLEKGHEILRKVEAIGTTKIDRKNRSTIGTVSKSKTPSTSPAGSISKKSSISPRSYARIKEQSSAKVLSKEKKTVVGKMSPNNTKELVKKQSSPSQDTVDGTIAPQPIITPPPPTQLLYAKEESIKFPRLESCKIIPPILGKTSEEHAELLVNVKTKQPTIEPPTATTILIDKLCNSNNDIMQQLEDNPLPDKDLYPDSDHDSDDSGHISNENDELLTITSGDCGSSSRSSDSCKESSPPPPSQPTPTNNLAGIITQQQQRVVVAASTKISELLEKFEQTNNSNSNHHLQRQQMLHHHHQQQQQQQHHQQPHQLSSKKICKAMKIAEVEPVKCIQTHIEIFPTYSKEVILRLM
ncbi:uncharacterized protein LOC129917789 [Episyrphus balteatus]|uniref:uncharacterized protein LOC129917789 n=1 Tax=Episyrphus balteatus TaxID=286459 RepID=UPI0024866092|nr:uncharacterized protein LOC129917789 [Episyrphus balteatus]